MRIAPQRTPCVLNLSEKPLHATGFDKAIARLNRCQRYCVYSDVHGGKELWSPVHVDMLMRVTGVVLT
jgi:hypothetical protein